MAVNRAYARRRADVGFLVRFWWIQHLVCNPRQEISAFDLGRTCHTLESTQAAGKMQSATLKSRAHYRQAFERVLRVQVRMWISVLFKTANLSETRTLP